MAHIPPAPPLPLLKKNPNSLLGNVMENHENRLNTCLYNLNLYDKKAITHIKHVPQTGPNCGIAALAMVTMLTPNKLSLSDIFNKAVSEGYTNNGEMFSVKNMTMLAETVLSPWFKVEMFSGGLAIHTPLVIERLYNGDLMLIPYDADKDHGPCCERGHKAHWALVCGVLVAADGETCVAARQGKSRHLAVWSLDSLRRSNDNLSELDPARASDGCDYLLPPGGLSAGLAAQFIILHRGSTVAQVIL